jgi:Tol biopolymer transport system component
MHAHVGGVLGMAALLASACSFPVAQNPSPGPSRSSQTSGVTPIISPTPSGSPLRGHIAYIRRGPTTASPGVIWVMKADGTGDSMLTDGEAPAWSPDGKRIAFGTPTPPLRIHVINLDGSSPAELTDGGVLPEGYNGGDTDPAWSRDGTRIAFIRSHIPEADSDGVYVMNADGSGVNRVSDNNRAFHLAWLANDQGIAFEALEDPTSQSWHFVLVAVTLDGSNRRLLFSVPGQNAGRLAVAPDGVHFAFSISPQCPAVPSPPTQCNSLLELCQIMVAGSDMQPVQVTHEGPPSPILPILTPDRCSELPSWSPDSSKVVFDDMHKIWVMNADGSNRQQITNPGFENYGGSLAVWTAA